MPCARGDRRCDAIEPVQRFTLYGVAGITGSRHSRGHTTSLWVLDETTLERVIMNHVGRPGLDPRTLEKEEAVRLGELAFSLRAQS